MLNLDLSTAMAVLAQTLPTAGAEAGVAGQRGGGGAGGAGGSVDVLSLALQGGVLVLAIVAAWMLWKRDVLRPGSFTRLGRDERRAALMPGDELLWLGLAGGVFICGMVLALASQAVVPMLRPADDLQGLVMRLGLSTAPLAAGVLTLWVMFAPRAGCGSRGQTAGATSNAARNALRGLGLFAMTVPILLVLGAAASWMVSVATGQAPPGIAHATLSMIVTRRDDPWVWALVAMVVIAVPVMEEVLYRGLLQTALVQLTGSTWMGIGITSVAFVAVHFGSVPPAQFAFAVVPLGVLSVSMGIALERTRSLAAPIVMHVLFNASNVLVAMLSA